MSGERKILDQSPALQSKKRIYKSRDRREKSRSATTFQTLLKKGGRKRKKKKSQEETRKRISAVLEKAGHYNALEDKREGYYGMMLKMHPFQRFGEKTIPEGCRKKPYSLKGERMGPSLVEDTVEPPLTNQTRDAKKTENKSQNQRIVDRLE